MNIIKDTGTHNTYSSRNNIMYIVIHYTAGVTSRKGSARNTASWFRNKNAGGSADFIVDDAEIVQYNPDPRRYACWAVGGGKYNNKGGRLYGTARNKNCVSIEICSSNKTGKVTRGNDCNWYFTAAAVNNAVDLTKYLMKLYGVPADRVIRHYDVNGKPCPGIYGWNADSGSEEEWQKFKQRIGGKCTTDTVNYSTASKTTTTSKNESKPQKVTGGSDAVRRAQKFCNSFVNAGIAEDGKYGPKSKRAAIRVLQKCINLDYGKKLNIDGLWGPKTNNALGHHYVKRGEKQYLVTAVEVMLQLRGYYDSGIETPGKFGGGLYAAVVAFQKDNGLKQDGIAGYNTLRKLFA